MSEKPTDLGALPELHFPTEDEAHYQVLTPDLMRRFFDWMIEEASRPQFKEPTPIYVSASYLDAADKAMAEGGEEAVLEWAKETNTYGALNACLAITGRLPL